jgi:hypothetical protein
MKKWIAALLSLLMLLSVCSFASAEELPAPFAHITFDGQDEGYTAITNGEKDENDPLLDGANKSIIPAEGVEFRYGKGPVGNALFLDGKSGVDLHLEPTNTDQWTVSFWVNASRLSDYGPSLQIGYNIGRSDAAANVTWMNVTQTNWTPKYFPTIWSRNKASESWPWMAPFADDGAMIGKREWALFTIVCSGEEQTTVNGEGKTVGAQLYVNGELRYDSNENYNNGTYFNYTWDATLAPNIMKPDEGVPFEAYFGVNYWDTIFKGYVDDLYVFDTALNADQVALLYAMGDPAIDSPQNGPEEGEAAAAVEEAPAPQVEVKISGKGVGAETLDTPFWGAHSDIWNVPVGESASVSFTQYCPPEGSNWNTFVVVLQNTPQGHSAADAEGYAEYAVVRADNFGWGAGYDGNENLVLDCNWNWDTFLTDMNGATVIVTVTNNGDTADVLANVITLTGAQYYQSYKGIAITGDLNFCLGVDNSCLDVTMLTRTDANGNLY